MTRRFREILLIPASLLAAWLASVPAVLGPAARARHRAHLDRARELSLAYAAELSRRRGRGIGYEVGHERLRADPQGRRLEPTWAPLWVRKCAMGRAFQGTADPAWRPGVSEVRRRLQCPGQLEVPQGPERSGQPPWRPSTTGTARARAGDRFLGQGGPDAGRVQRTSGSHPPDRFGQKA